MSCALYIRLPRGTFLGRTALPFSSRFCDPLTRQSRPPWPSRRSAASSTTPHLRTRRGERPPPRGRRGLADRGARAGGEESEGTAKTGLRRSPAASWSAESPPQGRERRFATRSGPRGGASSGRRNAQRTGKSTPTRPRARRSGAKKARNLPAPGQASPSLYPSEDPTPAAAPLAPHPPNRHHLRTSKRRDLSCRRTTCSVSTKGGPPQRSGASR